ncbi:hypothetical protein ACHQM5_008830 [Ranunculus cassubicifolius]
MKATVIIFFIVIQLAGIFAARISNTASAKCGSLGVMSTDNLPEGITSAYIRPCADHPLGHKRAGVQSLAPMSKADLASRMVQVQPDACYYDAPYGCTDGYCWASCGRRGSGQWCWLAINQGVGAWLKCSSFQQCAGSAAANSGCGQNCKEGSKACGCSCDH